MALPEHLTLPHFRAALARIRKTANALHVTTLSRYANSRGLPKALRFLVAYPEAAEALAQDGYALRASRQGQATASAPRDAARERAAADQSFPSRVVIELHLAAVRDASPAATLQIDLTDLTRALTTVLETTRATPHAVPSHGARGADDANPEEARR
jgi:hypothetical protein